MSSIKPPLSFIGFDWDDGNRDKCRKYGVSLGEIESIFRGVVSVFPDPAHSQREERFKAIGTAHSGRHLFIVLTMRVGSQGKRIRPISARYMHKREIAHYEKEIAEAAKR